MERDELMEWLESCPTHKWEITIDSDDYITVTFPVFAEEDFSDIELLDPDFDEDNFDEYNYNNSYD